MHLNMKFFRKMMIKNALLKMAVLCMSCVPALTLDYSLFIQVPESPLADHSLQVGADKSLALWADQEHEESFDLLQKIASFWKESGIAKDYLVYGKHTPDSSSFHWEIVPHYKSSSFFGDLSQQISVLWNITFGGQPLEFAAREEKSQIIETVLKQRALKEEKNTGLESDAFCKVDVIEKQWVLKGKQVDVLYNYAPIGFGGERLHFLIIPKEHKERFEDLTTEEYVEISQFATKLIQKYSDKDAYLFHKAGKPAGQTVPHFHMHLVFTSNKVQDMMGKLTVFKNMFLGSSPMKGSELENRVQELRLHLSQ